jgi:hypothetical protein
MEIPLSFQIGHERYWVDDPMPDWKLVDGTPFCDRCGKSLRLDSWASPPRAGLASCACAEDGREVVQVGSTTPP